MTPAGQALLKRLEGLRLNAYLDDAGVWTIGWGHTRGVREGDVCTLGQAQRWFDEDLSVDCAPVIAICRKDSKPTEVDALSIMCFNIGLPSLKTSTALRCHNAHDTAGCVAGMKMWNKTRDPVTKQLVVNAGLVNRRAAEVALYLS